MHGGGGVRHQPAAAMHGADGDRAPPPAPRPALEPSGWTRQQDKLLELLLCRMYPRWDHIALHLGDKTPDQARRRYESMLAELRRVLEAPLVETPPEWDLQQAAAAPRLMVGNGDGDAVMDEAARTGGKGDVVGAPSADGNTASATAVAGGEALERAAKNRRGRKKREVSVEGRNRAVPWSADEHKLFLAGIKEHGTGKWQKLSREFVPTRNASQIASHYQKYTIRQAKLRRNECKRPSIHDINDDTTGAADRADEKPDRAAGEAESGTTDDESGDEYEVPVGELFSGEDGHGTIVTTK